MIQVKQIKSKRVDPLQKDPLVIQLTIASTIDLKSLARASGKMTSAIGQDLYEFLNDKLAEVADND